MDATSARSLLNRLEQRTDHRLTAAVPMDANVKALLGPGAANNRANGRDDAPLLAALVGDKVAWDDKTKKLVGTASSVAIDEKVRPLDKSPTFDDTVEQCMEFAMRYFRTVRKGSDGGFGADWQHQRNIASDVRTIADGSKPREGYTAYLNGGAVPPRAGDVLSFETTPSQLKVASEFHVCIISQVYQKGSDWFARVYEANVPYDVNDPDIKKHYEDIPLRVKDGKFTLQQIKTSARGYDTDMDVVGWIHPLEPKKLPGAVAKYAPDRAYVYNDFGDRYTSSRLPTA